MLSLVQINVVVNSGSTGHIVEDIGEMLLEHDGKSHVAYGRNKRCSQSQLIKVGTKYDMLIHGLQTRLFDKHGLASSKATIQLIKKIKEINPDIIHLHNIHGYYLNYQLLFGFLSVANIPIVWTLHDCWSYTGHCGHYTEIACDKWKLECHNCPQIKQYPTSLFYDRSKNNYRDKRKAFLSVKNMTIVPVSHWLASEVKQSFLGTFQIRPIYNGINTDVFKEYPSIKQEYGIENKMMILGVSNIWDERKGYSDMLQLSNKINADSVIVLVGLSSKQMKKLPRNIIGIQRTEDVLQLAKLYSSADVYVNTSVEETFGLTTVESLACGTPVVVYNSTACPEIVTTDVGFIVPSHDINAIAESISIVRAQGKAFFSHFCREYAVEKFNKRDRCKEYIQLYNEILNKE